MIKIMKKINVDNLLGDIGELTVAFELAKRGFYVSLNLSNGFDVLTVKNGKILKIEVKTRYPYKKNGNLQTSLNFFVSKNELKTCDFIFCYIYGNNDEFLIVQPEDITLFTAKSGKGKINAAINNKKFSQKSKWTKYINNWKILEIK